MSVNVEIRNPFLAGNPTTNLQDFGGGGGASNGDPIYTRSVFYYGRVTAKADECSGLREVRFGTVGAGRVTTTSADGTFPLPEFELTDGPQTVQVEVVDGANHSATFTGTNCPGSFAAANYQPGFRCIGCGRP
ncbi:MAG: hypothetical protein HC893_12880 [Chloroflexaceae bacterium]|nr:hypothetical protein [Chloroflexaceae bacterium]